ncbi:MAG TPA: Rieske (2Fe-2S) protein [Jatrophihabitantaceae bacterium]|nr:Rieske (2Fe-2S) protein [Jatrophihabitantaceae bacterium]
MIERELSRRSAIEGAAALAVGAVAGAVVARNSAAAKTKRGTTAANAYGAAPSDTGKRLAALADVPSGGGIVIDDPAVVVVRGAGDEVHAFSAVCTHQGCTVDKVAKGQIQCPCHGSRFDAATGHVTRGPASRPLPPIAVVVRNGEVFTS